MRRRIAEARVRRSGGEQASCDGGEEGHAAGRVGLLGRGCVEEIAGEARQCGEHHNDGHGGDCAALFSGRPQGKEGSDDGVAHDADVDQDGF